MAPCFRTADLVQLTQELKTAHLPDLLATCWTSAGNVVPGRNGDVSPLSVEERVAAVAKAGYRGFGIAAPDLVVVRDSIGYPALAQMLDENGLCHLEVEYLQDWWTRGDRRRASDDVREVLFEAAAELGADHVKVGLGDREDDLDEELFVSEFDRLATEAHTHGTRVGFEPPADSMMPTIFPAADLVRAVANPAGGLLVDIWHIFRSGTGYDQLVEVLPPEYVFAVELSDGRAEPVGTLYDDTFDNRLPPGGGEFDVVGFIRAIDALGFEGPWGLEVMSTELRSLPVEVATKRVFDAAERVFEVARAGEGRAGG